MDKSSKDIENSSSQYFEACSNSKELNNILEEKEREKASINNLESNKEYIIQKSLSYRISSSFIIESKNLLALIFLFNNDYMKALKELLTIILTQYRIVVQQI